MKIKDLENAINKRLEQFDGKKYEGRVTTPEYHKWYANEIAEELSDKKIDIFRPSTWKIVADIEGPGEVKVSFKEVAEVKVELKIDRRYSSGGPGKVVKMRVHFQDQIQELTIEEARVYLLKCDLESRIAWYENERVRLEKELAEVKGKIEALSTISIEEAKE